MLFLIYLIKIEFLNTFCNLNSIMSINLNTDMLVFPELSFGNLKNKSYKKTVPLPVIKEDDVTSVKQTIIKRKPCDTVSRGESCTYGARCTFAHAINELVVNDCMYGRSCYLVKLNKEGEYVNNGYKLCTRKHPEENLDLYHKRVETKKYVNLPYELLKFSAKFTKMCRTYLQNIKCETEDCQYAHKIDDLVLSECGFKENCIHIMKDLENGSYINADPYNKVCVRRHPGETPENVVIRRSEEVEKPSYALFPKGVSIKVVNGRTLIKSPQDEIVNVTKIALENGIKDLSISVY